MKRRVRFFSSLYISLLCASISSNVLATQAEKPERWFEIEVILFKQLGNKDTLKEQFPDNTSSLNLPQYKKYFDLLTPYVQPNLSGIKQFLPLCVEKDTQNNYFESAQEINTHFSDALKAIAHFDTPELTTKQSESGFDFHNKELASPLFSTKNICIITRNDIKELFSDEQLASFQLDAFDVESLPSKLNASGAHLTDSPYLVTNESLLLTDIKQRLQWSKEFQPLLHFGWRQVGVTRDKAIPIKLFAGKHLNNQYQQALSEYRYELNEAERVEQLTSQALNNFGQESIDNATAKTQQSNNISAEIKQQKLTQLFNDIKAIDSSNINNLINDIEQHTVEELIVNNEKGHGDSAQLNISNPPVAPKQPWFLDGFFKVHLDHYLYITADFNVLTQSTDKSTYDATDSTNMKLINFSQNKRAITGEIHYFDHPYVGMIVQIRRFDPSKPKGEAVSQVVN